MVFHPTTKVRGFSHHVDYTFVDGDCYCPDYYNRKRGNREQKMTLDEWIEKP